ncbi:KpsF/GutQ family sugar-phosphate isomerase [Xanthovirga aplysinae]|uniref:KpsF/GutQ family sugar-phosphate isomerase n=1 Tax=Xanthovirga aplysinae TaxID=2529853 RepID=UPI0012BC1524|nr:KpsF/GutQ family sugar-phosphate isomerase [Xanthovirga aplysinae]MTI29887.1 KpsF/GutQ family sugar-phosphate isomerase [Xanthovirga aplysinae]
MNLVKNIKNIAKEVLLNESEAIKKIIDYLDLDFEACVEAILASKGRVVVTGVGKSAHIANKIVATLNSTGTPALFMHAADAIHGDLGMVQKEDVVICISKSGNTPEVKVLVPLIKRIEVKLVALCSNTTSYLAKQADFVLNASIEREACPNNLAPTTSTTAHLAMGDALAVCLLQARNFSSQDFARYHPGGALGKKLYLKVDDLYKGHECPTVKENSSLKEVIIEISTKRLGAAAVVNEKEQLLGIITDGDLRRMLGKYNNIAEIKAKDIMSPHPKLVEKGTYATSALKILQENNISQLVVTDEEKVLGFVHIHDLLKEGIV